ncbi:MAG: hypothetical protein HY554_08130 [Elusimicrobia bacterium]|nr:hypothetical protein [Elusimicrobiota bacterium]
MNQTLLAVVALAAAFVPGLSHAASARDSLLRQAGAQADPPPAPEVGALTETTPPPANAAGAATAKRLQALVAKLAVHGKIHRLDGSSPWQRFQDWLIGVPPRSWVAAELFVERKDGRARRRAMVEGTLEQNRFSGRARLMFFVDYGDRKRGNCTLETKVDTGELRNVWCIMATGYLGQLDPAGPEAPAALEAELAYWEAKLAR